MKRLIPFAGLRWRTTCLSALLVFLVCGDISAQENGNVGRRRSQDDLIIVNRSETVRVDQKVRSAVVIGGDIVVDGIIDRDLVVVGGSAVVHGEIGGELILIGGKLEAGSDAIIRNGGILVGGPFEMETSDIFERDVFQFPLPGLFLFLSGIKAWIAYCVFLVRPFAPSVAWTMVLAGLLTLVNFLILILLGSGVDRSVKVMIPRPLTAFFVGLLGFVLLGPLLVLVTATGVGALMIPFVLCALVAAILIGKVAVYSALGQRIGERAGFHWDSASIPAFLSGSLIVFLLYLVPFLGGLVLGVVIPLAFGAILMTGFQMFKTEVDIPAPRPSRPFVMPSTSSTQPTASSIKTASRSVGADPKTEEEEAPAADGKTDDPVMDSEAIGASDIPKQDQVGAMPGGGQQYERAGFWVRMGAVGLDFLLLFFGLHLLDLLGNHGAFRRFVLIWMVYHIVLWSWKGTTVGGMIMNLKLIQTDGRPVTWGTSVMRSLSSFFSLLALGLGFLWVSWNDNRQSWHDIIAGTVIIKEPQKKTALA